MSISRITTLLFLFLSSLTYAQLVKPTPIEVKKDTVDYTNKKLIVGEVVQEDDAEEYEFSEERSPRKWFKQKELVIRYENGYWEALGTLGKNVEVKLKDNPEALKEFKKYKRKMLWGRIALYGGVAVGAGISILVKNYIPVLVIGSGAGVMGTLWVSGAEKHLYKAVEIYNSSLPQ
ncbi:MAG: hypothetical protein GY827_12085 [Cytophagales bacterium]|nr:hypothetical protein [Cytophagales bacterium]